MMRAARDLAIARAIKADDLSAVEIASELGCDLDDVVRVRDQLRGVLTFTVRIATKTGLNAREHQMARHRRVQQERAAVVGSALVQLGPDWQRKVTFPCVVTFTRISSRLADSDNCVGACKSLRDQVASELGVSDGPRDARVTWRYAQELGSLPAVRITIAGAK